MVTTLEYGPRGNLNLCSGPWSLIFSFRISSHLSLGGESCVFALTYHGQFSVNGLWSSCFLGKVFDQLSHFPRS